MFQFSDKFDVKSLFEQEKEKKITFEDYPTTSYYKIESGEGWKNSSWEKVYKVLRQKSKTYLEFITPYEHDEKYSYIFKSTNGRGHSLSATASTQVNLSKYKNAPTHKLLFDDLFNYFKSNNKATVKLHIISDFFDNERNKKLNDLGRAINLIHEGVHASLHYNQEDFLTIVGLDKQHYVMQVDFFDDIQKMLKEYDSKLNDKDLFTLSMVGLTAEKAGGNKLIVNYAKKVHNATVSKTDKKELEDYFNRFLSRYKALTEDN
ncbi:hypothetical protein [Lacinutrix sp. Hel_I_90]|uniref:hypothetical protein n=1 Tax=Lacinutrix sp. Hel_I_90 TaxID=1249999 RepID=UPI0005C9BB95|nr:hypothetical protein [Lacinutrix sp. Hel_I_90]